MSSDGTGSNVPLDSAKCFRHAKRGTGIRCTRCERYICTDCMRDAPVGYQCPECVREGSRSVRAARTVFGGRVHVAPAVTFLVIALNVLAYLVELAAPGSVSRFTDLGNGLVGPDGRYYFPESVPVPGYHAVGIAHGEWYRLITSSFLHELPFSGGLGITHIVFNMVWLSMLGRKLEGQLGPARFLTLYLLSAFGGGVMVYLLDPTHAVIGASGAIFGLAAGYFVLGRRGGYDLQGGGRLMVMYLLWMVLSAGFASWQGHLGGLLTGAALAVSFAYAPRERRMPIQLAAACLLLLLLVSLVVLKTSQLTGTT